MSDMLRRLVHLRVWTSRDHRQHSMLSVALLPTLVTAAGAPAPLEDVPTPAMLGSAESSALAAGLFAADFMSHFAPQLGLTQALSFVQLHVRPLIATA